MINLMYHYSSFIKQHESGDDNLVLLQSESDILFCIADGAGGISGGYDASQYVAKSAVELLNNDEFTDPLEFESFLRKLDIEMFMDAKCGESTAIVGKIIDGHVVGASSGDSEAWLLGGEFDYQLTCMQHIKPLLGSGKSIPIGFGPMDLSVSLVIGSDGLFKYAQHNDIKDIALKDDCVAEDLAYLAKTCSGKLQDDVSVIIVQTNHNKRLQATPQRTRRS